MLPARSVVWCDTDAGFDDLLALGALARSGNLDFVTTTSGVCEDAKVGADHVQRFLRAIACDKISVLAGLDAPSAPSENWLTRARARMSSWMEEHGPKEGSSQPGETPAAKKLWSAAVGMEAAVKNLLEHAEDNSVHILTLGPLTNMAHIVSTPSLAELLQQKVRGLTVMGGNKVLGTTEDLKLEFNFKRDPGATSTVLTSMLFASKITLVSADVCAIDLPEQQNGVKRLCQGTGVLSLLAQAGSHACVFDPVAAYCALNPVKVHWRAVGLVVDSETGLIAEDASEACPTIRIAETIPMRAEYFDWLIEMSEVH